MLVAPLTKLLENFEGWHGDINSLEKQQVPGFHQQQMKLQYYILTLLDISKNDKMLSKFGKLVCSKGKFTLSYFYRIRFTQPKSFVVIVLTHTFAALFFSLYLTEILLNKFNSS